MRAFGCEFWYNDCSLINAVYAAKFLRVTFCTLLIEGKVNNENANNTERLNVI